MKETKWKLKFGIGLVALSVALYFVHYMIFDELHHMILFALEDVAFIPIEVLFVSLILHKMLEKREKQATMEKLNMLIGVFFSEVGSELLSVFASSDDAKTEKVDFFKGVKDWETRDFKVKTKEIKAFDCNIDTEKIDFDKLFNFLKAKRGFLMGLLQNPSLLEHESFTELLRAVFHLEEEFQYHLRDNVLTEDEIKHLQKDMERVYPLLVHEWIIYMLHVKSNYPYLFALAARGNPFQK